MLDVSLKEGWIRHLGHAPPILPLDGGSGHLPSRRHGNLAYCKVAIGVATQYLCGISYALQAVVAVLCFENDTTLRKKDCKKYLNVNGFSKVKLETALIF